MIVGVPRETFPGEHRVALTPALVPVLTKLGAEVFVETGAGVAAGFADAAYIAQGAQTAPSRADIFRRADLVLTVRCLGANADGGAADLPLVRKDQWIIGFCEPLSAPQAIAVFAATGGVLTAMELIPRTTRAQSMDALSSMATIAGYKGALLAAMTLPKMFPLMMTAAGTLAPAKVLVLGAGVAGLQAIASSRRLGAVVQAYDVRPVVKEQVESLGAKFLELPLETGAAQDKGGYAKELGEDFYRRQREMMLSAVAAIDVVISTAAVPGKKAPTLITAEMVAAMAPGSVIVDLAAERGGNCELTRPGETVVAHGVTILGPVNLPSTVPAHASQMYAKNIVTLAQLLIKDGKVMVNLDDDIVRDSLVAHNSAVIHAGVKAALGQ